MIEDKELGSRDEALAHIKQRQEELTQLNTAPTVAENATTEEQPEEETL